MKRYNRDNVNASKGIKEQPMGLAGHARPTRFIVRQTLNAIVIRDIKETRQPINAKLSVSRIRYIKTDYANAATITSKSIGNA